MSDATRDLGEPDDDTPSDTVGPPPVDLGDLHVRVRHASLEHAPYQLLVGHYHGLPLSGAEAQLNRRSEGRLERLLLTQQYPQQLGDIAILDPVDDAPPRGAIIVGLGPSGELPPLQLRGVVARALLRVALNELDRRLAVTDPARRARKPLGVSSVVVGSSTRAGLSIEASVRAVIDGTIAANARLTRLSVMVDGSVQVATRVVSYNTLEFIERYEDRVDLVVSVLAHMEDLGGRSGPGVRQKVHYHLKPERGEGRSSATSPIDAANEVWRRVDIQAPKERSTPEVVELEYTSLGNLARAPVVRVKAERAVLDPLLADAVTRRTDPDISGTLYELLVPHDLKGELGAGEHLHLLVDEFTADYPWELMRPRPDSEEQDVPLALRVGLLRQFRETERIRFDVRRASGHNALVIGNPPSEPAVTLPGAMNEARAVAKQLRSAPEWEVTSLIWDTAGRLLAPVDPSNPARPPEAPVAATNEAARPIHALHQLLNGDWRIVHIAAHGALTTAAASTGVLLGDLRLTANVFSKLSVVPDLVVVNACHLGRVLTGANQVAASVGRALLGLGVRAVVVAGWAVDDGAAEAFATRLYEELLDGADFGRAVRSARGAAWDASAASLTWGAYQCYGDPGFSLTSKLATPLDTRVHTAGELRRRLQRLRARASDQGRSALTDSLTTRKVIFNDLRQLRAAARKIEAPRDVYAEFADVWAELLELPQAVYSYRRAIIGGGSEVPIRAVEQMANLASRYAQQLVRKEPKSRRDVCLSELYATRAVTALKAAMAVGHTGERWALLGGHHKRMATMTEAGARADHVRAAVNCYHQAQRLQPKPYHEQNWIQLCQVATLLGVELEEGDAWTPPLPARQPSAGMAESDDTTSVPVAASDFWTRAKDGDRLVTEQLVVAAASGQRGALPDDAGTLISEAYLKAFRLRSSERERDSVLSHLRDLCDLLPAGSIAADRFRHALGVLSSWSAQESAPAGGRLDPMLRTGPTPS